MKDNKLISMVDFVLGQTPYFLPETFETSIANAEAFKCCRNYANFLKQPLTLGMFVPCDKTGKVLEEPSIFKNGIADKIKSPLSKAEKKYQQAKERVLFEGFEVKNSRSDKVIFASDGYYTFDVWVKDKRPRAINDKTIEDLIKHDITLTPNAIKQIGL